MTSDDKYTRSTTATVERDYGIAAFQLRYFESRSTDSVFQDQGCLFITPGADLIARRRELGGRRVRIRTARLSTGGKAPRLPADDPAPAAQRLGWRATCGSRRSADQSDEDEDDDEEEGDAESQRQTKRRREHGQEKEVG
jgi:hypothetical protein